jgi:hypothetical protein
MLAEMYDGIGLEEALRFEHQALPIVAPEALASIEPEVSPIAGGNLAILPDPPGTEILDDVFPAILSALHSVGVNVPDDVIEGANVLDDLLPGLSLAQLHGFFTWLGVDTYLYENGNINDVCDLISQNYMVILSGDVGEIYGFDSPIEDVFGEHADRAFVIKSFDLSDPENPMVTLYRLDGSGADGMTIPLEQLEDAWADGGRDYLVISDPYLMDGSGVVESVSQLDTRAERLSRHTM